MRQGSFTQTGANTYLLGRVLGLDPSGTISLISGYAVHSSCSVARIGFSRQISRPTLSTTLAAVFQGRDNR